MFKKIFFHALVAGVLTALAATIYNRIYFFATEANFSKIINISSIISLSVLICFLIGIIYYGMMRLFKRKGQIIFNFFLSIISFCAVMYPISVSLPLDIKYPELFPGLAVPMVFFPAMAWYTIKPIFNASEITKFEKGRSNAVLETAESTYFIE
jgi:hypothetical protein